jgi:hypothetical protein
MSVSGDQYLIAHLLLPVHKQAFLFLAMSVYLVLHHWIPSKDSDHCADHVGGTLSRLVLVSVVAPRVYGGDGFARSPSLCRLSWGTWCVQSAISPEQDL